jgi:hypothetical protein
VLISTVELTLDSSVEMNIPEALLLDETDGLSPRASTRVGATQSCRPSLLENTVVLDHLAL